jgi:putative DNA primase/helicase
MYNLNLVAKDPTKPILVVEGERACDAANELQDEYIAVTWPGGAGAYRRTDWAPLSKRNILMWPDADKPGRQAMDSLRNLIKTTGTISMVDTQTLPDKFDAYDALQQEMSFDDIMGRVAKTETRDEIESSFDFTDYFRMLGYSDKGYYFLVNKTGQVHEYSGTQLGNQGALLTLAPDNLWSTLFDWNKRYIADALIRRSEQVGFYTPDVIRGRGAWEDEGRSVLHLGSRLVVDGQESDIRKFKSKYIYRQSADLSIVNATPLPASESSKLIDICLQARWRNDIYGRLLAGWIFSAVLCGTLPWRSHIYISGKRGSGKTWIAENIINACLEGLVLHVQGKSTEAGLRQSLMCDARPVIFDESEAESQKDIERMQCIFDLARQASSDTSAKLLKGSADQKGAVEYKIKSSFAFCSIIPSFSRDADASRITTLELLPGVRGGAEEFEEMKRHVATTITKKFAAGLISRASIMAPVIKQSYEVLSEAGQFVFGDRRASDQFATMLAGYYALLNDRPIENTDDALELIRSFRFHKMERQEETGGEQQLLEHILQAELKLPSRGESRSVGWLLNEVWCSRDMGREYDYALKANGIRMYNDKLAIANQSSGLAKILKNTQWSQNWGKALQNHRDAKKSSTDIRFGPGHKSWAVLFPIPSFEDRD